MTVKDIKLFSDFSEEELNKISKIVKIEKRVKNDILFFQGDSPKFLHILLDGVAKVYKLDNKSNEIVIHHFQAETLIAELANLENMSFPANCMMDTDGVIARIEFAPFRELMENNGKICLKLLTSLTKKMKFLDNTIQQNIILNSTQRVAKFIYENEELFLTLKQHKIASILNIKPETMSRILKKFKELEIIENDKNNFIIKDNKKLRNFF